MIPRRNKPGFSSAAEAIARAAAEVSAQQSPRAQGAGGSEAGGQPRPGEQEVGAPQRRRAPEFSEEARRAASAYPGSLTYLDLIRWNKRESALLIAAMILLGVVLGGLIGGALGPYFAGLNETRRGFQQIYMIPGGSVEERLDEYDRTFEETRDLMGAAPLRVLGADVGVYGEMSVLLPSILIGAGVALVMASAGAAWAWYGGSNAILTMAGAIPLAGPDDPVLFNVVDEMRIAAGLPMPRVYIINDSALNAFATGRDPQHAAIAVTRGLRERLTRDQLQGVIAHEMAHIRHYDIRFAMLMATMVGLIVFACDAFLRIAFRGGAAVRGAARAGGRRGGKDRGGVGGLAILMLVLAVILSIVAPLLARMIQFAYSRRREYLADAGAVELTRNPQGLAEALAVIADDPDPLVDTANRGTAHMYIVNPLRAMARSHQTLDTVFSSHPPIQKRIARLLALMK